jgi:RNA polymerase sigma factor (sigma-70 family)
MDGIETLINQATNLDDPIEARQQAFGEIVNRFQDMAYGRAYAMLHDFHLAQDAAQEAFIEAWRNLHTLQEPKAFPGWFKRIVIRRCSRLTRRKSLDTAPLEDALNVTTGQPDPHTEAEQAEIKALVHSGIQSLSEPERTTTTLFYIDGYTQHQIADFLEVPVTTVNMRLHRARKRLKERMVTGVQELLQGQRPSRDEKFVNEVLAKRDTT